MCVCLCLSLDKEFRNLMQLIFYEQEHVTRSFMAEITSNYRTLGYKPIQIFLVYWTLMIKWNILEAMGKQT